jgi:hypothetical protein
MVSRKSSAFIALAVVSSIAARARADEPSAGHVTVVLHADSPRATLERRDAVTNPLGLPVNDGNLLGLAHWTPECTAPCEVTLDPKFTYRIAGDGLVPSDSFVLPRDQPRMAVDATMGSSTERLGGLGMAVLGAGGLVLGASAMAVSPILAKDDVGTPAVRTGVLAAGIGVTALSAVVFGIGMYLWNHNETQLAPADARGFVF